MKRLFFALWPDEQTRQHIDNLNQTIKLHDVKKLKASNIHVTLLFLGNIAEEWVDEIQQSVTDITLPEFTFQLDGLNFWPKPKVICLTASYQPQALYDLVTELNKRMARFPISIEERPYRAHVTLARKAKQAYEMDVMPIQWQAKEFVLVESNSTRQGVRYDVLARWSLQKV